MRTKKRQRLRKFEKKIERNLSVVPVYLPHGTLQDDCARSDAGMGVLGVCAVRGGERGTGTAGAGSIPPLPYVRGDYVAYAHQGMRMWSN